MSSCWPLCCTVLTTVLLVMASGVKKQPCPSLPVECRRQQGTLCENCCPVCVRGVNETCGRPNLICDSHLHCTTPTTGASFTQPPICKDMWSDHCLDVKCDVVFPAKCADDSYLLVQPPDPPYCCQKQGKCVCEMHKCRLGIPYCPSGFNRIRLSKGTGQPGTCCDVYKCRPREKFCANHPCPPVTWKESDCPEDSYLPASYVPDSACCPINEGCRCRAGICPPVTCEGGLEVTVTSKGNGRSGTCCDQFHCSLRQQPASNDSTAPESITLNEAKGPDNIQADEAAAVHILFNHTEVTTSDTSGTSMQKEADYRSCIFKGEKRMEGEKWYPDPCTHCRCIDKLAFCSRMSCDELPAWCTWSEVPPGECCPVCRGCREADGRPVAIGERWRRDACTNCTCLTGGRPVCDTQLCGTARCEQPQQLDGHCCPVCDGDDESGGIVTMAPAATTCPNVEHCPLRCEYGLERDDRGCFLCRCDRQSELSVSGGGENDDDGNRCSHYVLTAENCPKQCAHGYLHDEKGCAVCRCAQCPPLHHCYRHCLYGFKADKYGCPVCRCNASPEAELSAASMPADGKCRADDKHQGTKGDGEWWHDGCRHCFCDGGREFCGLIHCRPNDAGCPPELWRKLGDDCCPSCAQENGSPAAKVLATNEHAHTVCQAPGSGRVYTDGERWTLSDADCLSCTCRVGHVLCHAPLCPPVACAVPIKPDGDCCFRCSVDDGIETDIAVTTLVASTTATDEKRFCKAIDGRAYEIDTDWRVDDCTSCICIVRGATPTVKCFQEDCLAVEKTCPQSQTLAVKGRCCPVCADSLIVDDRLRDGCAYAGARFAVGDHWRDGDCRNCSCVAGGQTVCLEYRCPPAPVCDRPIRLSGQCCLTCADEPDATRTQLWQPEGGLRRTLGDRPSLNENGTTSAWPTALLVGSFGVALLLLSLFVLSLWWRKHRRQQTRDMKKSKRATYVMTGHPLDGALPPPHVKYQMKDVGGDGGHYDACAESLLSNATMTSTDSAPSSSATGDTAPSTIVADERLMAPTVDDGEPTARLSAIPFGPLSQTVLSVNTSAETESQVADQERLSMDRV